MKTVLYVTACLLISGSVFSQNVGIGIDNPNSKLHVAGNINVHGSYLIYSTPVLAAGGGNLFVGGNAGYSNVSTYNNTFSGSQAGYANTIGNHNSFFGVSSGYSTTSSYNSFFGSYAGYFNNNGNYNSFFGNDAGYDNTSGFYNSFFGSYAGTNNTVGTDNSFFGRYTGGSNTTGNFNSFFGSDAGITNTEGYENSFFGKNAGYYNVTGDYNCFFGESAGYNNNTGYDNSFFGESAGLTNTTGTRNTAVGYTSGFLVSDATNATAIGHNAKSAGNNVVRIGDGFVNSIGGQVAWSASSDARIKDNIQENVSGLAFIKELRPVTYHFNITKQNQLLGTMDTTKWAGKYDIEQIQFSGFIAQEVEAAALKAGYDFSGIDKSGEIMGLRYAEFTVPLVKAMQEQQVIIEEQQKQIDELKKLVNELIVNRQP